MNQDSSDTNLFSHIIVLELLVSYLLARVSFHSGDPVNLVHDKLIDQLIKSCVVLPPENAGRMEAETTAAIDRLVLIASHMRQQM